MLVKIYVIYLVDKLQDIIKIAIEVFLKALINFQNEIQKKFFKHLFFGFNK